MIIKCSALQVLCHLSDLTIRIASVVRLCSSGNQVSGVAGSMPADNSASPALYDSVLLIIKCTVLYHLCQLTITLAASVV